MSTVAGRMAAQLELFTQCMCPS
nr:hypothetical protein [Halomonas citrativorans]